MLNCGSRAECILWEHPDRVAGQFAQAFEVVESYENSSDPAGHCINAGSAASFIEWYEWVDWKHGNDKQYSTPFQFKRQRK